MRALKRLQRISSDIDETLKHVAELKRERRLFMLLAARLMGATGPVAVRRIVKDSEMNRTGRSRGDIVGFDHPDSRVVHAFKESFGYVPSPALVAEFEAAYTDLKHKEL